ncbi:hypothetical protein GCM10009624_22150 [Gordonia sinesedis]
MTYPSGSYPTGPSAGGPPPRPDRSPWASPVVLVAIAAGILLVVGGALAAFLLIPSSSDNRAAPPSTSVTTTTSGQSVITKTITPPPGANPGAGPTVTTEPVEPTTPHASPTVPGADWQGFTDGPRCNAAEDPAIVVGQTSRSRVVICQVGTESGRWYYKGLAAEGAIEIGYPTRTADGYRAVNKGVVYVVSPASLTISQGGEILSDEPMLAYWSLG